MLAFKRGKRKIIIDYGIRDIYKFYRKNVENPLSIHKFISVLTKFHDRITDEMVGNNYEFFMPARLGTMYIRRREVKLYIDKKTNKIATRVLRVDYKKTKEKWKELYPDKTSEEIKQIENKPLIFNLHQNTDGKYAQWYWDIRTCTCPNKSAYVFEPVRANKEKISDYINTFNKVDYYE